MYAKRQVKTNEGRGRRIAEIFLLGVLLLFLLISGIPLFRHMMKARNLSSGAAMEARNLRENSDSLTKTTDELITPEGIDRYVRDTYHVAEPGEVMMLLLPEKK